MIAKEVRNSWWAVLAGLAVLALGVAQVVTIDLRTVTLATLQNQSDAAFTAVSAGRISGGSAYLWATFFADNSLYLLVGLGGVLFGARLVASEVGSGSIFLLLSRPLSRQYIVLTKYGVAAVLLLALCCLSGAITLFVGAMQGVPQPPFGGLTLSVLLLWLGTLFVMGITLVYSVLIPSALAAGFLGFFSVYVISIAPLFHLHTPAIPGGREWSMVTYWSSLNVYAGVSSAAQSLLIALAAAAVPLVIALALFRRKAF